MFRHSLRNRPLNASMNALPVGVPGGLLPSTALVYLPLPKTSPLFIRGFGLLRPLPAPVSPSPLMETHMRKSASPAERHNTESPEHTQVDRPSSDRAVDLPDWVTRGSPHPSRAVHRSASEAVGSSPAAERAPSTQYVMLSLTEYAALFRISAKTVRRMIDRGELSATRIGRSVRIPASLEFVNTFSREPHCFR